jgi:carboxyl-terminal processing protease
MKQQTNNKKLQAWLPLLFAIVMIAGMVLGYKIRGNTVTVSNFFKLPGKRTPLQEVLDLVKMKYVDDIGADTLADDAIQQVLSNLDPHSIYIPPVDLSEINEDLQGNFQGIGVEFQIFDDTVHVVSVLPAGPSDKAGIQVGDKFLKVGDTIVAGNKITNAGIKKLLRGPGSSNVNVLMMHNNKPQTFTIRRGTIPLFSVDAAYILQPGTGYIKINKFSENTYEEFMAATEKLQKAGMQNMVLDLRGNGGGILGEAIDIADEFLDGDKLIVYTEGAHAKKQEFLCKRQGLFEKGKLAVLVDENAASASEVLAGALQDWDRATILGRRTFGKGLVQEQYNLSDGGALRLTIARYYTPTGRSIQKPYTHDGTDSYTDEINKRYQHGELLNADSNKIKNGKAYTTKSGRTVYGGGGIMPDVFVGYDTSRFSKATAAVFASNGINNFVYRYYINNKPALSSYKTPAAFAKQFNYTNTDWDKFINYVRQDSVNISQLPASDKVFLNQRLKAYLARYIWRNDGFYQVLNENDIVMKRALEELGK